MEKKYRKNRIPNPAGFRLKPLAALTGGMLMGYLPGVMAQTPTIPPGLPQPCQGGGACNGQSFVGLGNVNLQTPAANVLNINQLSQKAYLNWKSFNIDSASTVNFHQLDSSSIALNKIWDQSPSKIRGKLNANGQIYLLNSAGIIFEKGAQVNVGALLASTLDIDKNLFANSSLALSAQPSHANGNPNGKTGSDLAPFAALQADATSPPASTACPDGPCIDVKAGASISTGENGSIDLFAPQVTNDGLLHSLDGQVLIAAAKDRVFLVPSYSSDLRGFLVEVQTGGKVENNGTIKAERGNVTLEGHDVAQNGTVTATTSVNWNGSVYLLSRQDAQVYNSDSSGGTRYLSGTSAGSVTLGDNSLTQVQLELNQAEKAIDANQQLRSKIEIEGKQVQLKGNAKVVAHNGDVAITADQRSDSRFSSPTTSRVQFAFMRDLASATPFDPTSRVQIDPGASIDVSGSDAVLPMSTNLVNVQLFANELKNSPLQRNGVLHGMTVTVDRRKKTPLADVSAAIANVPKSLAQRTGAGGSVNIHSDGDLIFNPGASINVSGGVQHYLAGYLTTTKLVSNGKIIDIGNADPNLTYQGVLGTYQRYNAKWGVTQRWGNSVSAQLPYYAQAYDQGMSAGTVQFSGRGLLLQGSLLANTVSGPYQRDPGSQPQQGSLIIGADNGFANQSIPNNQPDHEAPNITLVNQADAQAAVGLQDRLSNGLRNSLTLSVQPLVNNGFGNFQFFSNGTIRVSDNLGLNGNTSFSLAAPRVDIGGSIKTAGGHLAIASTGVNPTVDLTQGGGGSLVTLGDGVSLDMSGTWQNDYAAAQATAQALTTPYFINGGSVSLSAVNGSDIAFGSNDRINVSGSARLDELGKLQTGTGGDVSLTLEPGSNNGAVLGGDNLSIDGRSLGTAGKLSITTPSLSVTQGTGAWQLAASQADPGLVLYNGLLQSSGFQSFDLTATNGDLNVDKGININLVQQSLQITNTNGSLLPLSGGGAGSVPTDSLYSVVDDDSFRRRLKAMALPQSFRHPVDLSLSIAPAGQSSPFDLHLAPQSGIVADPGATIDLSNQSSGRILMAGAIKAPGGAVNASLGKPADDNYNPNAYIWLGAGASIDVAGQFVQAFDPNGLVAGKVWDGGAVNLDSSGYIVLDPGSKIDASGTQAALDYQGIARPNAPNANGKINVASNGGSISLDSVQGAFLGGNLLARAGNRETASGGSLTLSLNKSWNFASNNQQQQFPTFSKSIQVLSNNDLSTAGSLYDPGTGNYQDVSNLIKMGVARLGADQVSAGGFDSLQLTTGTQSGDDVELQPGLQLHTRQNLEIDTSTLTTLDSGQGDISLDSAYVSLGSSASQHPSIFAQGNQDRTISLSGQLVDFKGDLNIENINWLRVHSKSDIRLTGTRKKTLNQNEGSLNLAGTLTLQAQRIYTTTNSDYAVHVTGFANTGKVLKGEIDLLADDVSTPDAQSVPFMSVNSRLSLAANTLYANTLVSAPFGELNLDAHQQTPDQNGGFTSGGAGQLRIDSGARLSVSGGGEQVPYGFTINGKNWSWGDPQNSNTTVPLVDAGGANLISPAIHLSGGNVQLAKGSQVDLSASGDFYATEFVPGVGGSQDFLAASTNANRYVILPARDQGFAPVNPDPSFSALPVGTAVHLEAVPGLAAGDYTLLPARYALVVPGARIITLQPSVQSIQPGQGRTLTDGTPLAAGYFENKLSGTADNQYQAFSVRPASDASLYSEYQVTAASGYFPQALSDAGATQSLNYNAGGILQMAAGQSATLQSTFTTAGRDGARAGEVDISADNLLISGNGEQRDGFVTLSATDLSNINASSLLLGGHRTQTAQGESITADAGQVLVGSNTSLNNNELLLTATNKVGLETGASLSADKAQTGTGVQLQLNNQDALVGISDRSISGVTRAGAASGSSAIDLAQGARLSDVGGSVILDTGGDGQFNGTVDQQGGNLFLGAGQLTLAGNQSAGTGTVLSNGFFSGISKLQSLNLRSLQAIGLLDGAAVSASTLNLTAPGLSAQLGTNGTASLSSDQMTFNGSGGTFSGSGGPAGQVALSTGALSLTGGDFTLGGATTVNISATRGVTFAGSMNFSLPDAGQVTVTTPLLTGDSAVDAVFSTSGNLNVLSSTDTTAASSAGLGAKLAIDAGQKLSLDTALALASGWLTLSGSQGLNLGSKSRIDVSGENLTFDNLTQGSRGGQLTLQSAHGDVVQAAGAKMALDGGQGAEAGTLQVTAAQGTANLQGSLSAASDTTGGSFNLDAGVLGSGSDGDFAAINQQLNAGGFTESRQFRLHNQSSLTLGPDTPLDSRNVGVVLDQGALTVAGHLGRQSHEGGEIQLTARDGVSLSSNTVLDASANQGGGGRIDLETTQGSIDVADGASLDVSGVTGGGVIQLRAPRTGGGTDIAVAHFGAGVDVKGANQVRLDGFQTYNASGTLTASDINTYRSDAGAFTGNSQAIASRLGRSDFEVVPGVEVDSTGDLALNNAIDFSQWRFDPTGGGAADTALHGDFTVRAAGALSVNQSLSDGFSGNTLLDANSFSYRLVAGADLSSADSRAVVAGTGNDLTLASGVKVRTGDGDIDLRAGGNIRLADSTAVVYSAGRDNGQGLVSGATTGSQEYTPVGGGNVSLTAEGDLMGGPGINDTVQFWEPWLRHQNYQPEKTFTLPNGITLLLQHGKSAGLWIDYSHFQQGIAAFGGGNLNLSAGGNIVRLAASVPTTARYDQPAAGASTGQTTRIGQGNLKVDAGQSILSSDFMVGEGVGKVLAGDNIGADRKVVAVQNADSPGYIGLMGGQIALAARANLSAGSVINPTLLVSNSDDPGYVSYTDGSRAVLTAIGGDLAINTNSQLAESINTCGSCSPGSAETWSSFLPANFTATALSGNLTEAKGSSSMALAPSPTGNLELLAGQDLTLTSGFGMLDWMNSQLPTLGNHGSSLPNFANAPDPNNATLLHATDRVPVYLVARNGDIQDSGILRMPKSIRVYAGGNINDIYLDAFNTSPTDASWIQAGGDISLATQSSYINVSGPGRLNVVAGHNIDLGASNGIETTGSLKPIGTTASSYGGADLTVMAGVKPDSLNYATYLKAYQNQETQVANLAERFRQAVKSLATKPVNSLGDAVTQYVALTPDQQTQVRGQLGINGADMPAFLQSASLEDAIRLTLTGEAQTDTLISDLRKSDQGVVLLQKAVADYTGNPGISSADSLTVLQSLDHKARAKLVADAFYALPQSDQLALTRKIFDQLPVGQQDPLLLGAFFNELRQSGDLANQIGKRGYDRGFQAIASLIPNTQYNGNLNLQSPDTGNLNIYYSDIYTRDGGNINLLTPGGGVNGGVVTVPTSVSSVKPASELGVVAQDTGAINALVRDSFLVNQSRVFTLKLGDILMWASKGDLDAGRGAKSAVTAPQPQITVNASGQLVVNVAGAIAGSGIRQIDTSGGSCDALCQAAAALPANGVPDSSVDLIAPNGTVNAGDAGIGAAGNLNIAAAQVIGTNNIDIGGLAVGLPPANTGGLAAGLSGVSNLSSSVSKAAEQSSNAQQVSSSPEADRALAWLEVFVLGFGGGNAGGNGPQLQ